MVEFPDKKIYLCTEALDFRCGINTLSNLVSIYFPTSDIYNSLYLFFSKNNRQVKILEIEKDGKWLYQDKLNDYKFIFPKCTKTTSISSNQLKLILKSIENVRKRPK